MDAAATAPPAASPTALPASAGGSNGGARPNPSLSDAAPALKKARTAGASGGRPTSASGGTSPIRPMSVGGGTSPTTIIGGRSSAPRTSPAQAAAPKPVKKEPPQIVIRPTAITQVPRKGMALGVTVPWKWPQLSGQMHLRDQEQLDLEGAQARMRANELTRRWVREEAAQKRRESGATSPLGANSSAYAGMGAQESGAHHQLASTMPVPVPNPYAFANPSYADSRQSPPSRPKPAKKRSRKGGRQAPRDPNILALRPSLADNYDPDKLTWDRKNLFTKRRSRNAENKYCYCGTDMKHEPAVQCTSCGNWFHVKCCTHPVMKDEAQFLPFQLNYRFVCKCCNYPTWTESFTLTKSSWIESVLSAQAHLMWKTGRDIFRVAEVADFVENNWHLLCVDELRDGNKKSGDGDGPVQLVEKDKKEGKWRDSFNSYWTTHEPKYFTRPERGYWGLKTHKDIADADETNKIKYTPEQIAEEEFWGPAMTPCRIFRVKMTPEQRRKVRANEAPLGVASQPGAGKGGTPGARLGSGHSRSLRGKGAGKPKPARTSTSPPVKEVYPKPEPLIRHSGSSGSRPSSSRRRVAKVRAYPGEEPAAQHLHSNKPRAAGDASVAAMLQNLQAPAEGAALCAGPDTEARAANDSCRTCKGARGVCRRWNTPGHLWDADAMRQAEQAQAAATAAPEEPGGISAEAAEAEEQEIIAAGLGAEEEAAAAAVAALSPDGAAAAGSPTRFLL